MPFVLAPFLWRRASRRFRRPLEKAERAHGDGILVDLESPEAFEEVFWMTFGAEGSAGEVEQPTPDALRLFARYRRMVVRACDGGDEDRYLSKNNANLGRLPALCADSAASVLVCYRDPASTALSLHRQHQRFVSAQQQEPFIRDYMGWLGHFEFGLDHRPLDIAGNFASRSLGPGCPDYWLGYWIALHTYLLTQRGLRLVLVGHQRLCADPEGMLSALLARIGAVGEAQVLGRDVRVQPQADPGAFNGELLSTANAVFVGLSEDHRNISP